MLYYLFPTSNPESVVWPSYARWIQWLTYLWLAVGLIILLSASYPSAITDFGDGLYYVKRQLLWVLLGIIEFNILIRVPIAQTMRIAPTGLLVGLILIMLTLVKSIGISVNGASRWIAIGPILIQPSEIIKPFLILQAGYIFASWKNMAWKVRSFWLCFFGLIVVGILLQPNLSTATLCGFTLWLIALAGDIPLFYLGGVSVTGLVMGLISLGAREYQRQRIITFINPWADPTNKGYQLVQSLLAVGSGRWIGTGLGLSQQKLCYLPIQYTDFIFAVFAEEFGFLGCFLFLNFLIIYTTLGLVIAIGTRNSIHRLIGVGSISLLSSQSLINIGVAVGVLPTTGLPLPFFSYGGNALLASMFAAALLVRISLESNYKVE